MKCPHCDFGGRATVTETRQFEDSVYRRRSCGNCGKPYITQEIAPPGLKMPTAVSSGRARGQTTVPNYERKTSDVIENDAAHLQGVWS